jgi:alpha-1,2-mannosyltransferase
VEFAFIDMAEAVLPPICFAGGVFVALLAAVIAVLRGRVRAAAKAAKPIISFLHPFCNDGGGGERVLWVGVRDIIAQHGERVRVVVYTGDAVSDAEIRAHALSRFGVRIPSEVEFVRLALRGWIEPKRYPVATLVGQALGSLLLAAEAVARCPPAVLVDTTGLHFCLPLLRLLGVAKLACYVHYPIISSDMVGAVASRTAAHNNARVFARTRLGAGLKLAYYRLLVRLYARAGQCSDVTMANGTWTANHLRQLWGVEPRLVFPPCDTQQLQALPLEPGQPTDAAGASAALGRGAQRLVLSVAQFRPEKDHAKQLRAFAQLLTRWAALPPSERGPRPTLVVAGAVRHAADARRLDELRELAASLTAEYGGAAEDAAVRFAPNLSMGELYSLYGQAAVGLHTMWNEHFGIGVVEMCAAGLAVIAHNSGGPALDIVREGQTGLLADSAEEYAEAMVSVLLGARAEARRAALAAAGREAVATRFSEEAFARQWRAALEPLL